MKKWDWIILCTTVCTAMLLLLAVRLFREDGAYVVVSVDGEETARYALSEEIDEDIQGVETGHIHLVIHNKMADVTEASCPDHLCVHQASISKSGETIVCLPNRVVVRVMSQEESPYDAIAN